jgi:hypothetical protein
MSYLGVVFRGTYRSSVGPIRLMTCERLDGTVNTLLCKAVIFLDPAS